MVQRKAYDITWGPYRLVFGKRTLIMGVLNVTPDSFSDGGLFFRRDQAVARGEALAAEGADVLDVGGESTRPFSEPVSAAEEKERILPVIRELVKRVKIPISVDTCKAEVAAAALDAGAAMVNDVSALRFDPEMGRTVARFSVPLILMHMQGTPRDMQVHPHYDRLLPEIRDFLAERIRAAQEAGIAFGHLLVDPGIGFGKTFEHNLTLLKRLDFFRDLDRPLVLGTSRKAFIGKITGRDPLDRDRGTAATLAVGAWQGAHMVRVHNVQAAKEVLAVTDAIREASDE